MAGPRRDACATRSGRKRVVGVELGQTSPQFGLEVAPHAFVAAHEGDIEVGGRKRERLEGSLFHRARSTRRKSAG